MVCARYLPTYRKRHAMTLSRSITHTTNCSLTLTLIRSLQIRTHHCGDDLKATKQYITCTYEHMYTCTYAHIYLCTHVPMYTCIYVHMYLCTHVPMYTCIYVHMSLCTHVPMYTCPYVHMYLCTHVHIYLCTHIPMYTYTHNFPRRHQCSENVFIILYYFNLV